MSVPILAFAATLVGLQWIGGRGIDWGLPVRTIVVFVVVTCLVRALPWLKWLENRPPRGLLFRAALFLFLVRHFVLIFGAEARRAMLARRIAVPKEYASGWFSSLHCAVTGILNRSLIRAERFYVSQSLRGVGE
jgi:hypothetical protein